MNQERKKEREKERKTEREQGSGLCPPVPLSFPDQLLTCKKPDPEALKPVWMDTQDLLLRFHICRTTLYHWRGTGLLRYYKVRGKIYYRENELVDFFEKYRKSND